MEVETSTAMTRARSTSTGARYHAETNGSSATPVRQSSQEALGYRIATPSPIGLYPPAPSMVLTVFPPVGVVTAGAVLAGPLDRGLKARLIRDPGLHRLRILFELRRPRVEIGLALPDGGKSGRLALGRAGGEQCGDLPGILLEPLESGLGGRGIERN